MLQSVPLQSVAGYLACAEKPTQIIMSFILVKIVTVHSSQLHSAEKPAGSHRHVNHAALVNVTVQISPPAVKDIVNHTAIVKIVIVL